MHGSSGSLSPEGATGRCCRTRTPWMTSSVHCPTKMRSEDRCDDSAATQRSAPSTKQGNKARGARSVNHARRARPCKKTRCKNCIALDAKVARQLVHHPAKMHNDVFRKDSAAARRRKHRTEGATGGVAVSTKAKERVRARGTPSSQTADTQDWRGEVTL